MSDFVKASDDIKLLAKRFKPLLDLAAVLESVGSIDQAAKDAEARKQKAYDLVVEAEKELQTKKIQIEQADLALVAAEEKAEVIVSVANHRAAQIVEEAKEIAGKTIVKANQESAAQAQRVQELKREAAAVGSEIQAKKDELEDIQNKIREFRAKITAFSKL